MLNPYDHTNHNSPLSKDTLSESKRVDFSKYADPSNTLSAKELKWGFWLAKNRLLLYRSLIGFLIFLCVMLWGYSLLKWGNYLIFGIEKDRLLTRQLAIFTDYTAYHPMISAVPLQIISVNLLPGGVGKYDAVTEISNPNSRHIAYFDYSFEISGAKTHKKSTFLLPGEIKLVGQLGLEQSGTPNIILENLRWKRISNRQIENMEEWKNMRLKFEVDDFMFQKSFSQGADADMVSFDLTNQSAFNYVEPEFMVALMQNSYIAGVLPLKLDKIYSLETKKIDLRIFAKNSNITDVVLYPDINIFDSDVYLK